ncbi:major facilitator superfamily transporter [Xylariaceae sp. FL1651]|nr:major facilitator superfamily transporter [Xylariaceae sp. FL1651]
MPEMAGEPRRSGSLDEPSETAPLLQGHSQRPRYRQGLSVTSIATSITSIHVPKAHNNTTIINVLCVIIFVVSCSAGFLDLSMTRLVEDALCHEYYNVENWNLPIDEKQCKEAPIQEKLAYLLAILSSANSIAGFVAALPWGLVADKIGRKPVVALALFGLLFGGLIQLAVVYWRDVFPLTAIWASAIGPLIGGGNPVLAGVIFSMVSDATSEEQRTIAFLRIHVANICGNLLSPSLSALLMEKTSPWVPPWVGITFFIMGGVSFLFLPETFVHKDPSRASDESEPSGTSSRISRVISHCRDTLSILKSPSLILLLLTALFAMPILYGTLQFLNQFVSKRYGIKISQTGYVQTVYGIVHIVQSLVILPWLSGFLIKPTTPPRFRSTDEQHRDLALARWSYGILLIGALVLGLSPTLGSFIFGLIIMAFGSGFSSLTKSLMSTYVDTEHRSRLFSIVAMVEVLGSVYAQPMLAVLFSLGLKLQGGWIGLPYYGLAGLIAVGNLLLLFVKTPNTNGDTLAFRDDNDSHID